MNDTGKQLVEAARTILPRDSRQWADQVVAAVLRELSEGLYRNGESAIDPAELVDLADDIEGGGE